MKTMQQLAAEAISVQDACNTRAVVAGMVRAMDSLRELGVTGTDELRSHNITVMWAYKIADLCNVADCGDLGNEVYSAAYAWCLDMSTANSVS